MGNGAAGALLTYNLANVREVGPMTEEEQRVWFARKAYLPKWVRNWWGQKRKRVRTEEINVGLSLREREK